MYVMQIFELFQTVEEHMQLSFSHIMKHWKRNPNQPGATKIPGSRNVLLRFYPPQSALGNIFFLYNIYGWHFICINYFNIIVLQMPILEKRKSTNNKRMKIILYVVRLSYTNSIFLNGLYL